MSRAEREGEGEVRPEDERQGHAETRPERQPGGDVRRHAGGQKEKEQELALPPVAKEYEKREDAQREDRRGHEGERRFEHRPVPERARHGVEKRRGREASGPRTRVEDAHGENVRAWGARERRRKLVQARLKRALVVPGRERARPPDADAVEEGLVHVTDLRARERKRMYGSRGRQSESEPVPRIPVLRDAGFLPRPGDADGAPFEAVETRDAVRSVSEGELGGGGEVRAQAVDEKRGRFRTRG